ncbi:MAG: hypothetical protein ACI9XC_001319 [Gammaproteobacteria bacterium]|jgi:hypothetical protein
MCGDDDDINHIDEELFNRFIKTASTLGVTPDTEAINTHIDITNEKDRTNYMDSLFKAGLTRAVNDAKSLHHGDKMDVLAGQAIVFARLSGLLAGSIPPGSDMFHTVVSALMQGYKEAGNLK